MATESDTNILVGTLARKVRASIMPNGPGPETVLQWLATESPEAIRAALIATQPKAWAVAVVPWVDSLTPEQRIGALAAFIAVWVQAQ